MSGLSWKSEFTFGKYRGLTVEEVASFNPSYLAWAVHNLDHFDLDKEARQLGQRALTEHREQSFQRQNAWAWGFGSGARRSAEKWQAIMYRREFEARSNAKARARARGEQP